MRTKKVKREITTEGACSYLIIDLLFGYKYDVPPTLEKILSYLFHFSATYDDIISDDGIVYKWISKTKILKDMPYMTDKYHTVYCYFDKLNKLGFIEYKKINHDGYKKDAIRLSDFVRKEYGKNFNKK